LATSTEYPKFASVKRYLLIIALLFSHFLGSAQCAMCTKTAASLDDKAAKGLNGGIIYLAFMPLTLILFIGYRWWKNNRETI